jgi:hypothetical protein
MSIKNWLLIEDEDYIVVQPTLLKALIAKGSAKINLNSSFVYKDALFLHKLHFDCMSKGIVIGNYKWIHYTPEDIQKITCSHNHSVWVMINRLKNDYKLIASMPVTHEDLKLIEGEYYRIDYRRLSLLVRNIHKYKKFIHKKLKHRWKKKTFSTNEGGANVNKCHNNGK